MDHTRRDVFGIAAALGAGAAVGIGAGAAHATGVCGNVLPLELGPEPASPPLMEGLVPSGTAKLWYWDTGGKGPAVVLLHPASGSGKIWRYQQQAFVDAGFRLIGYSRRGSEGSEPGQPDDKTTPLDDLRAVLAHLKVDRFCVMGTAAGASIATAVAVAEPGRVTALSIACSMVVGPALGGGAAASRDRAILQGMPLEIRELGPSYRVANPSGTARWIELSQGRADAMGSGSPPPRRGGGGSDGPGPGTLPPGPGVDIKDIRVPTLVIAGEADMHAPPPVMAEIARAIPNGRLVTLPACGHSGYWEVPGLFNAHLIAFFKRASALA